MVTRDIDAFRPPDDFPVDEWKHLEDSPDPAKPSVDQLFTEGGAVDRTRNGKAKPGERIRVWLRPSHATVSGELRLVGNGIDRKIQTVVPIGVDSRTGTLKLNVYAPEQPGTYNLELDGHKISDFVVAESDSANNDRTPPEGADPDSIETDLDPSNYAGIVNADNEQGVALAPRLRREGAELGPEGATVNLQDGETVEVGAIQDADEVARYVDGEDEGEVVDSDEPATDPDSDSSNSGTDATTSTGDLGPAVAVVALLGLGYAAQR